MIKKILKATLLATLAIILFALPVLAAYYAAIQVVTTTTAYTMLPVMTDMDNDFLVDNSYITATGRDVQVQLTSTNLHRMLASDKTLFASALPAASTNNFRYLTGETATDFAIVTGTDGYVTIDDAAALEPGNVFEFDVDGYFDTSTYNQKFVFKDEAYYIGTSTAGNVYAGFGAAENIPQLLTNGTILVSGATWAAETFLAPSYLFEAQTVEIGVQINGGAGNTITLRIRATDATGQPTGGDLSTGTVAEAAGFLSVNITDIELEPTETYAIVVSCDGDGCLIERQNTNPYADGSWWNSADSGLTWAEVAADDMRFRVNGVGYGTCGVTWALASGDYRIQTTSELGTNTHKLYVNTVERDSVALGGASVPNNANDWQLMLETSMPYIDYYIEDVGGAEIVNYAPATIVVNTYYDGTADAGGDADTIIDAELTQADDYWNLALVTIVTTTDTFAPQGETSICIDFADATNEVTLLPAFTAGVDAGDTYTIEFGTLLDLTGVAQNGRITWGVNPADISYSVGSLISTDITIPSTEDIAEDVLPSNYDATLWGMTAPTNAYSDIVNSLATAANVPAVIMWVSIAMGIVLVAIILFYIWFRNIMVAGLIGAALIMVFVSMGLLPKWAMILVFLLVLLPMAIRERA